MKETNKGITLVALIITIIVMLILVGVSIQLVINSGLFETAKNVAIKTEEEYKNESAIGNEIAIDETTYSNIEEYIEDVRLVLSDHIKIGDYVEYKPQTVTEPYKIAIEHSGYDSAQEITQDTGLKWRVLSVDNENRTIELISATPTSNSIGFKGSRGYNNCVYLLNDACNYLYSNETYGATARSINIEDIQNRMDLSVWDYHDYDASGVKYGDTFTYTYGGDHHYPKQWANDVKAGGISSTQDNLIGYSTEEEAYEPAEGGKLTVINTAWNQEDMSDKYINANTRNMEESSNMYYQLINITGKQYWLATRYTYANSGYSYANFSLRHVSGKIVAGGLLSSSRSRIDTRSSCFRPIVTISYKHINLKAGYNETKGWSLK